MATMDRKLLSLLIAIALIEFFLPIAVHGAPKEWRQDSSSQAEDAVQYLLSMNDASGDNSNLTMTTTDSNYTEDATELTESTFSSTTSRTTHPTTITTKLTPPIVPESQFTTTTEESYEYTNKPRVDDDSSDATVIVVPIVVLFVLVIFAAIAGYFLWRRNKKAKEDEARAKNRAPVYGGIQPIVAVPISPAQLVRSGETGAEKLFASGANAPFHMPVSAFKHMGPVKLDINPSGPQKHILADVPDEEAPSDLEVHFDMENNLVFDIGSEVEERYDGDKLLPKKRPNQ